MNSEQYDRLRAVYWHDGELRLLDQRRLPGRTRYLHLKDAPGVAAAIRDMAVRGAPAIGIAAAYGVVLSIQSHAGAGDAAFAAALDADIGLLHRARPTAVNLAWALARMRGVVAQLAPGETMVHKALAEARQIHEDDIAANWHMGRLGAALIAPESGVLTHCNTGALATGGFGTALGVIRAAFAEGRITSVYAGETRPWLQGARLTAWELAREGIPCTLLADGAAAHLLSTGRVQWVIVGADRVVANGDVANKIGTLSLAVAARHFGARVMVVAPVSTLDLDTPSGQRIEIELRDPKEILAFGGRRMAPRGSDAWNPVFDITPAALVDVLVTERGVVTNPDERSIRALAGEAIHGG